MIRSCSGLGANRRPATDAPARAMARIPAGPEVTHMDNLLGQLAQFVDQADDLEQLTRPMLELLETVQIL